MQNLGDLLGKIVRTLTPGAKAPSRTAVAVDTCSFSDGLFSILLEDDCAITDS